MTIDELIMSEKVFLTAADVATILKCDPHRIRLQAQQDIGKLGFPAVLIGTRLRIPRVPFLRYIGISKEKGESK